MAIAPDRLGTGTNGLALAPPGVIGFRFGTGSFAAHRAEAQAAGVEPAIVARPGLAFDLDTPRGPGALAGARQRRMISLVPLEGIPEIRPGDDLAEMIAAALAAAGIGLTDDDVLVVTQKVVSKAEGRVVDLSTVEPRAEAREWAERWGKDPRQVELVLRESAEVVRMADGGLIISRTRHGFVCANAGVDLSNTGGEELATLLPVDPDGSARGAA